MSGRWGFDRVLPIAIGAFVLLFAAAIVWAATRPPDPPRPCSDFEDWPARSVPARCMKYFNGAAR